MKLLSYLEVKNFSVKYFSALLPQSKLVELVGLQREAQAYAEKLLIINSKPFVCLFLEKP